MALDFAAGCVGGCAGLMVGYPLDTIKVHIQTQDHRNPQFRGTWHCFRTILARDSVTGLYRGMTSPMAGVAIVNAIVFGVYGQTQRNLADQDHLMTHFWAGALAGLAQSPICSPLELAKTRLQLQSKLDAPFNGPVQCLRHVYRKEGRRGVFNGLGITAVREAPSFGVYFLTYEALTRTSKTKEISTFHMLMAGGLAGTASWVATYPIDVIKSRLQADGSGRYSGAIDCLRQSVRGEGYKWLFRGLNSTILRAFPTNAATFTVVTWVFRIFGGDKIDVPSDDIESANREGGPAEKLSATKRNNESYYEPFLSECSFLVTDMMDEFACESVSYYSTIGMMPLLENGVEAIEKSNIALERRSIDIVEEKTTTDAMGGISSIEEIDRSASKSKRNDEGG